jgi:vacuolar-type H+-ATPase subunit I/STV1
MDPLTTVSISGVIPKNATHVVYWSEGIPVPLSSLSPEASSIDSSRIQKLEEKIATLEQLVQELQSIRTTTYFPKSTSPVLEGIEIVPKPSPFVEPFVEPAPAEDEEEQEEEQEEQEEEEQEEEEEEALELTEFEWKGVTYYRDSENLVYQKDGDDLDDAPIGVWNVEKQKLLRYKV